MNFYIFRISIFDTAADADMSFFPRVEIHSAVAEDENEAQRQITDRVFDRRGTCGSRMREDDAADRFRISFGGPEVVRPVVMDENLGEWVYADELVAIPDSEQ